MDKLTRKKNIVGFWKFWRRKCPDMPSTVALEPASSFSFSTVPSVGDFTSDRIVLEAATSAVPTGPDQFTHLERQLSFSLLFSLEVSISCSLCRILSQLLMEWRQPIGCTRSSIRSQLLTEDCQMILLDSRNLKFRGISSFKMFLLLIPAKRTKRFWKICSWISNLEPSQLL